MPAKKTTGAVKAAPEAKKEDAVEEVSTAPAKRVVDPSMSIIVRNGFRGTLVYTSPRTGETYTWDSFGDEQEMELRELMNVKASAKAFFMNNWFLFDKEYDWVIDELKVRQYYRDSIRYEDFDNLFTMESGELRDTLAKLSSGQKTAVAMRARELVDEGKIDSLKVIHAIEDTLGIKLSGE